MADTPEDTTAQKVSQRLVAKRRVRGPLVAALPVPAGWSVGEKVGLLVRVRRLGLLVLDRRAGQSPGVVEEAAAMVG